MTKEKLDEVVELVRVVGSEGPTQAEWPGIKTAFLILERRISKLDADGGLGELIKNAKAAREVMGGVAYGDHYSRWRAEYEHAATLVFEKAFG